MDGFPHQHSERNHISVSHLEVIDAELQQNVGRWKGDTGLEKSLTSSEATLLGTLTHTVLERMEPDRPEQVAQIIESVLFDQTQQVQKKMQPLITQQISAWCGSELCQTIQSARAHYRELDFLLRWPESVEQASHENGSEIAPITIAGTVDALFQDKEGRWVLLDYKTGSRLSQVTEEQLIQEYEFQLESLYTGGETTHWKYARFPGAGGGA